MIRDVSLIVLLVCLLFTANYMVDAQIGLLPPNNNFSGNNNSSGNNNNNNNRTNGSSSGNSSTNVNGTNIACQDLGFSCDDLQAVLSLLVLFESGGIGLNVSGAAIDKWGNICCVVYSSNTTDIGVRPWAAARHLAAAKAYTALSFSLPVLALSSANMYFFTQPGGIFYGSDQATPVRADYAYEGDASKFGTGVTDPLVGKRLGGLVTTGGGLAAYKCEGGRPKLVGAIGVDGDLSCANHNLAWQARHLLGLDYVPGGVHTPTNGTSSSDDNIIYVTEDNAGAFSHPRCTASGVEISIRDQLPLTQTC